VLAVSDGDWPVFPIFIDQVCLHVLGKTNWRGVLFLKKGRCHYVEDFTVDVEFHHQGVIKIVSPGFKQSNCVRKNLTLFVSQKNLCARFPSKGTCHTFFNYEMEEFSFAI
jgi:hypothetical protein